MVGYCNHHEELVYVLMDRVVHHMEKVSVKSFGALMAMPHLFSIGLFMASYSKHVIDIMQYFVQERASWKGKFGFHFPDVPMLI